MLKNKSLVFKMIVLISGGMSLVFLAIFALDYYYSDAILMNNIQENARNFTLRKVNQIETVLASVKKIPDNLAYFIEEIPDQQDQMIRMLQLAAARNEEIYGIGIAFEPYSFDPRKKYFAPYYAKERGKLTLDFLGSADYDYFSLDWYKKAIEANRLYWSEPYFDDTLMVTCAVPFYSDRNQPDHPLGIVYADISLEWLTGLVNSIQVLQSGDAYLVSKSGVIVAHKVKTLIGSQSIFQIAEERSDEALLEIGKQMIEGESGFVPFVSIARKMKGWLCFAPVPSTGWSLAVFFPENELYQDIRHINWIIRFLALAGLLLLITVVVLISRSVTRPLVTIAKAAAEIGRGQLDIELPGSQYKDEVGRLAAAFNHMSFSLKDYIQKLTETTAAKEKIESELKIAHDIQISMLPRIFPPFPDRREFDIYALMEPAKEVGGDFYDFFMIDDHKLGFVIGDVSGKGVPAALFMVISKTLLKTAFQNHLPPHQVLMQVNNMLYSDNDSSMFVTVLCMVLDLRTGNLQLSNAGHNPPLICSRESNFSYLTLPKGFVLGAMPDMQYKLQELTLKPNDTLFLYTDGVTEAMDVSENQFSEQRLQQSLQQWQGGDISEAVRSIRSQIADFARGAEQSDDITMLTVQFIKYS